MTYSAIAVTVPARDEADRLPGLLRALARQRNAPPFTLYLYLDTCSDKSRAVVEALAPTTPFPIRIASGTGDGLPNAGRARAAAASIALSWEPLAILSTDADSEPAPDWVAANVAALASADLVAGRILLPDTATGTAPARLTAYYDRLHQHRRRIDPVPWEDELTHHWTSACSLAVRADVYRALRGFAALPRGEDADFADRAWRAGHRLRRDARAVVRTSVRRRGRVEGGFATMLAELDGGQALPHVAHPEDEAWRYRRHVEARAAFASGELHSLATSLRLPPADVGRVAADVPNADAFAARVVGTPLGGMRAISLAHAEIVLDALEADIFEGAA